MEGMADQARRNYERTVRKGHQLQEQAGNWWTRILAEAPSLVDYQRPWVTWSQMAGNMMPLAQRRMADAVILLEKSGRTSADLMRKAVDAAQTSTFAESQTKWLEFWTSSLKAMQHNVEVATEIGTKTIDTWVDLVRRSSDFTEGRRPKTI
jgi:hypothetical protein